LAISLLGTLEIALRTPKSPKTRILGLCVFL
jgi:hypothetical protein